MRRAPPIAIAIGIAALLAACPKRVPPLEPIQPIIPAPAERPVIDPSACKRVVRIEVRKSERQLSADCTSGGRIVFPIALARERGAKRALGDQRMPEGDYEIAGPPRQSRFHLFLPFDYPSRADADRALAERRIDAATHAAIATAQKHGRMPPQDTPLGGALGLHGEGVRWRGDLALNWTEGCVALSDRAIEQLARLVRRGTPLRIVP